MATSKKPAAAAGKPSPTTGQEQVLEFLHRLEHPLKEEIEEVRRIILSVDPAITEHIKWNAPSFRYEDDDRVTFNLHGAGMFRLVFHCGAKAAKRAGKQPLIEDETGLLQWAAADRATIAFASGREVEDSREKLAEVVVKWLAAAREQ
ncbi:MAG: DUF1801 domain-containing protein [Paenibacillaceae bacterium]|nr:DUF1801 domain-containing protein [Paenibacillaceae bacterium]